MVRKVDRLIEEEKESCTKQLGGKDGMMWIVLE